jgi:hypothetical protein
VGAAQAYNSLADRFSQACHDRAVDVHESFYIFGGRRVEFRVVGENLSGRILRPFAHLQVREDASAAIALTVNMWDETEIVTTGGNPFSNLQPGEMAPVEASSDGRFVSYLRPESWIGFDRRERSIATMIADTNRLTLYELGRPLHSPLLLWHRDLGLETVHAGLVALDGRGVLFVGEGGSGKSTASLSCMFAGFSYLSDDYVGLEALPDGSFDGHSLYCSTHLEPSQLRRFPELAPLAQPAKLAREDKWLVLLGDHCPERLSRVAPIEHIVMPVVTGASEPRMRVARKGEALLRLAPTSLLMLPHARRDGLEILGRLVESVPCHWLELGGAPERIPDRVAQLFA